MSFFVFILLIIRSLSGPGASGQENWQHNFLVLSDERKQVKKQIPVLCYHNIKPVKKGSSPDYTIDPEMFQSHIRMLHDSGYCTILPDQLYEYLAKDKALPARPIMITFDDSHEDHFTIAAPILEHFGFRGVFFVMTVTIGKHAYLSDQQIKQLSDSGHVIAAHTWNHPDLRKLEEKDWDRQISQPIRILENITGKPVSYFAYPYGAWNNKVIDEVKKQRIKAAFQLSEKMSEEDPLFTIRRLMVSGSWSPATLNSKIKTVFK